MWVRTDRITFVMTTRASSDGNSCNRGLGCSVCFEVSVYRYTNWTIYPLQDGRNNEILWCIGSRHRMMLGPDEDDGVPRSAWNGSRE